MNGDTRCLCCGKEFVRADADPWVTPEGIGLDVGICDRCRRHAAIGRAVERMPVLTRLGHDCAGWWADIPNTDDETADGPTPLDALRAAGLVEDRSE